jgi:GDP-mannose 6-dehydrogenase
MRVSVFGLGYVGSVLCGCLADAGHEVVGVDVQPAKVAALARGDVPIVEPGLGVLVQRAVASGALRATADVADALRSSDVSLVCVGTPSDERGAADLRALKRVCAAIGRGLRTVDHYHSVVFRSTIPPGTTRSLAIPILEHESGKRAGHDFGVGYNPEFMREGNAVADFSAPPFTVVATIDGETLARLHALYERVSGPVTELPLESAELLKLVCNGFHAMKVAFANEIGSVCAAMGVDGVRLMDVFCRDSKLNVSSKYLRPGVAFGGSCLPKDVRSLESLAKSQGLRLPLLEGILDSNHAHIRRAEELILGTGRTRIGLMGLTFKAGTDDTRESPALIMTQKLLEKGCDVWVYEPDLDVERLVGVNREHLVAAFPNVLSRLVGSPRELAAQADVFVITKGDPRYQPLRAELRPADVVVDLAGAFTGQTLPCALVTQC